MNIDNKVLYENIMRNVARQVKRTLNEDITTNEPSPTSMDGERLAAAKALIKVIEDSEYMYEYPEMLGIDEFINIAKYVSKYFMNNYGGITDDMIDEEQRMKYLTFLVGRIQEVDMDHKKFLKLELSDESSVNKEFFNVICKALAKQNVSNKQVAQYVKQCAQKYKVPFNDDILELFQKLLVWAIGQS